MIQEPQVVGSGVGLSEIVRQPEHEIGERPIPVRRAVKRKVSVLLEAGDGIVLHADEVKPECHLMPAADHVHVVGHLERVDVEMSRGAGSAEGAESAGNREQQEVGHGAVHVDPEQRRIDRNIRRPAVIAPAVEGDVERVQRSRAEGVVVADGHRLRHLEVAGLRGGQQILAVVGRRDS